MGAFYLVRNNNNEQGQIGRGKNTKQALAVFSAKGMELERVFSTSQFDLFLFQKKTYEVQNWFEASNGDFACVSGTLVYDGQIGKPALSSLLEDWQPGKVLPKNLLGEFCLILSRADGLYIYQAPSGLYHIFTDENKTVFSSSFLAVSRSLEKVTISPQGFYEYILNGAVYGDETVLSQVKFLECRKTWVLSNEVLAIDNPHQPQKNLGALGFKTAVSEVLGDLVAYFKQVNSAFGSSVCSALSGGYDSRLILGLMKSLDMEPYLYVYGSDQSSDVVTARNIAQAEGLDLDHSIRENAPPLSPGAYQDLLRELFFLGDGLTNTGIFENGSLLATRLDRISKAKLQLNGGGGEIYRNFWVLPNQPMSPNSFLKSKYDRFDSSLFCSNFDKNSYFEILSDKVRGLIGINDGNLSRSQIEMLYPYFRLRYWMGMNNSYNSQFAYSLTPFGEYQHALDSFQIPLAWKNEGRFEAELIKLIAPALASYKSCYGFSFSEPISWKRKIKGGLKRNTPSFARPFLRRHVHKKGELHETSVPYFLEKNFLKEVGIEGPFEVSGFIDIEKPMAPNVLSRALSVELLVNGRFYD